MPSGVLRNDGLDEIDACWLGSGPVDGTIGPMDGEMLAISDMMRDVYSSNVFSLKNFRQLLADIFEMAELFETFATLRLMLAGPVGGRLDLWVAIWLGSGPLGGKMAWIWTICRWKS